MGLAKVIEIEKRMSFCKRTKGLTYTIKEEIFCAKVQMHKLGENLQQKYGNQSQRLQLFAEPVALFLSSHMT